MYLTTEHNINWNANVWKEEAAGMQHKKQQSTSPSLAIGAKIDLDPSAMFLWANVTQQLSR